MRVFFFKVFTPKVLKRALVLFWIAPIASFGVAVLSRYISSGKLDLESLLSDFRLSFEDTNFADVLAIISHLLSYLDSLAKTSSAPVSSTDVPEKALVPAIPPVVIPFKDSLFSIQGYSFHGESSKTVKSIDKYDWVGRKIVPFYKTL